MTLDPTIVVTLLAVDPVTTTTTVRRVLAVLGTMTSTAAATTTVATATMTATTTVAMTVVTNAATMTDATKHQVWRSVCSVPKKYESRFPFSLRRVTRS